MFTRNAVLTACGAAILGLIFTASTDAGGRTQMSLTFNRPVALPGVTLGTGTYIFEQVDDSTNSNACEAKSTGGRYSPTTIFSLSPAPG
jgi:hypothetical protein